MVAETATVALVTGGNRGIGAAIAARLAAAEARVVVAARGVDAAQAVAETLGAGALGLALDVTDRDSVANVPARLAELGVERVDWLVNNAGIAESAPLLGGSADERERLLEKHLAVNLHGPRRLIETLVPAMAERGAGSVVNVVSSAGLRGYAYVSAYCASKFALLGYTLSAALELRRSGVGIHAVCPHYVAGAMLDASVANVVARTGQSEEQARGFFASQNPGGKLVEPAQVADAVHALLSGPGTGRVLELDGGDEPLERTTEDNR